MWDVRRCVEIVNLGVGPGHDLRPRSTLGRSGPSFVRERRSFGVEDPESTVLTPRDTPLKPGRRLTTTVVSVLK